MAKSQTNQYTIRFIEENDLSSKVYQSYINYKGDSLEILNQLEQLIYDYQNYGFLAVSIDTILFETETVRVKIFEGKQYRWGELDYSGVSGYHPRA